MNKLKPIEEVDPEFAELIKENFKRNNPKVIINGSRVFKVFRDHVSEVVIERNEICPCGSGKKYKKCCMENDR